MKKFKQQTEFMTIISMHKRELKAKDAEIQKYQGLYGSACKQIRYLDSEIERLKTELTNINTECVKQQNKSPVYLKCTQICTEDQTLKQYALKFIFQGKIFNW
ncbi:Hypothetical_protein [Hexamita inflata]|uniref:Hypothetical_protein n=1 Tax=Hexamita inflata TaxID=28002 RepID=A0AA86PNW1_9EUKA|nr:Hypothetical protein HINF_LOCUS21875 [Hexamita inflata]CAI9940668.1 Hypothetical protein HINF_LOCUS28313 [Hexamita inflata]CAI9951997.1 Hypothetical protein HINF_LOCUS39642 [Hexamita inflata]